MKNKLYNRFLRLFKYIHEAALIICQTLKENDDYTIEIKDSIQQIIFETNEFINIPFDKIQDEIESNFLEFSKGKRESYIVRLLKDWIFIVPYFDISNTRESYGINLQMINCKSERYIATKDLIERSFGITEPRLFYGEATSIEKYILLCHTSYQHFFYQLNELCIDFDVDLVVLQEKTGIVAWDRFDPNFKMWKNSIVALPEKMKQNESKKTDAVKNQEEPIINKLKTNLNDKQLGNLFDNLNKTKRRIPDNMKDEFIALFSKEHLPEQRRIKWNSSSSELATLVYKLTDKDPIQSIVNKYFEPQKNYDSNNYTGKRRENLVIIKLIKSIK